jgi:GNAT superfamily N-acetyltransferase
VFLSQASAPLVLVAPDVAFAHVMRYPFERDAVVDGGVVPEHRRRGLGTELLRRVDEHARAQGWPSLLASAVEEEGLTWLEKRGFVPIDRQEPVVLELGGREERAVHVPDGIELTDFEQRADLAPRLHKLIVEGLDDVPGALAEDVPTLEAWVEWQRAPSRRPDFLVIALDAGEPVGYAQLHVYPHVGYHGFTVVARSHRGRGIARALKEELIRRAQARGLDRLLTNSNEANLPMRSLNAELGYVPGPTRVYMRREL